MLRSSSTKAIVGMSLLSETVLAETASNPAIRRISGFEPGQRAMQAGLKCDRVPRTLQRTMGPEAHFDGSLAEKRSVLQWHLRENPMQPTPDFDAARAARSLLRRSRQGALATLMAGSGDPYCSLVNVASHPDGSPILLLSRLALHTQNILADSRVSLMLDERVEGDPLEGSRIMLGGRAGPGGGAEDTS